MTGYHSFSILSFITIYELIMYALYTSIATVGLFYRFFIYRAGMVHGTINMYLKCNEACYRTSETRFSRISEFEDLNKFNIRHN